MMNTDFTIRDGTNHDRIVITDMLYEAFHWNPQAPRADRDEFEKSQEFRKLLADWGGRPGDTAVVAEIDSRPIGAAWYRFWTEDLHSYGYLDARYPEVGIGVEAEYRSRGVGRALLRALIARARTENVDGLSLSVEPANFAIGLYRSEGFRPAGSSGSAQTLLLVLS